MSTHAPHRVLIAGGGVAALETMLALRELVGHRVAIELLSAEREFLYRPVTVAEAFGRGEARTYDLAELAHRAEVGFRWGALGAVDPEEHTATTTDGLTLQYDTLVLATGAEQLVPLPGALTFGGRDDVPALGELLDHVTTGHARSLVFALSAERSWPLPLYELAVMTAAHAREHGADGVSVTLVTPEQQPLGLFGAEGVRAVGELLHTYEIALHTRSLPSHLESGSLRLVGGEELPADRVVTLPVLAGRAIPGIPHDREGFVKVDGHGRVHGIADVFAAGDITSFPVKQGGLAAQQADAVAEQIAAALGAIPPPARFRPVLRGLLLTGGAPLYLRCEPDRVTHGATSAITARPLRALSGVSAAAGQALWWPPAKIAGRYLAAYLATATPRLRAEPLADRDAIAGAPPTAAEQRDALELTLLLADCDARWGDYGAALSALESATDLVGALPPEYEAKRRRWHLARRKGG